MFQKSDHLPPSGKIPPVDPPTKFLLPPPKVNPHPLNNNSHVISQKTSFLAVVIARVLFSLYLRTLCITGHANFDFNQCSIFTDCSF